MTLLTELNLHPKLLKALDKMAFTEATNVQAQAIPPALAGKDLMVSAKTGTGKTAAFMLPMLNTLLASNAPNTGTRALILLPTRELALQTQKVFQQFAAFTHIKSGLIIGGEAFKYQVATLRKNPEVLIATPGRLVEHINKDTPDFSDLEILVLDEADRMLDMGFAIDMNTIATACRQERQNLLFSATLQHKSIGKIAGIFNNPSMVQVDQDENHEHIRQQAILADDDKHKQQLVTALALEEPRRKSFVFCNTRTQCQQLGNQLKYKKIKAAFIHGELSQSDRKQVLNQFRDNKLQVLVATDVAARGLDIDDIELVINFNVAQSGDDHIHRIGRTGRAGRQGLAITLINDKEWNLMASIERYIKTRFKITSIKGLKANYKGPNKTKKSGKAVGSKKKKTSAKTLAKKKTTAKRKT